MRQKAAFRISLCNLCVLCVSVVWFYSEFINHRDTENTEVAQRRAVTRLRWATASDCLAVGSVTLVHNKSCLNAFGPAASPDHSPATL